MALDIPDLTEKNLIEGLTSNSKNENKIDKEKEKQDRLDLETMKLTVENSDTIKNQSENVYKDALENLGTNLSTFKENKELVDKAKDILNIKTIKAEGFTNKNEKNLYIQKAYLEYINEINKIVAPNEAIEGKQSADYNKSLKGKEKVDNKKVKDFTESLDIIRKALGIQIQKKEIVKNQQIEDNKKPEYGEKQIKAMNVEFPGEKISESK
ncbi:MAG: hypothetical protein PHZ26_00640 [Candidatus Gracilibacteria bacterium]|nr:hypothetical protein [Candidatus Gracilibacteria bacterium]MDD2908244.1 hypothetical protein [Candidatus Gracilibacteria bacterium]